VALDHFEIIGVFIELGFGQHVQHIKTKNAHSPNIDRGPLWLLLKDLWCEIPIIPHFPIFTWPGTSNSGETEAGQCKIIGSVEENMLRIDVTMNNHDAHAVKKTQRVKYLKADRIVPRWNHYVPFSVYERSAWN